MDLRTLEVTEPWQWPAGAGDFLLGVLRDRQSKASDRLLAADLAGETVVAGDDLAGELLAIASNGDEEEELRCSAAISLGPALEYADTCEFSDPDDVLISEELFHTIRGSLRRVYEDTAVPDEVRRRVLEASVRAPEEWHRGAVREAYRLGKADWRLTAVFCMRHVGGFEREILEALGSEDPLIRYEAVRAAGNWELDGAWRDIVRIAGDEDTAKALRLAAIEALGNIRPEECGLVLVDFENDADEDIVEAATETMVMADARIEACRDEEDEDE